MHPLTPLWRRAHEPVAAHELATALLPPQAYMRTRGVAQQAARLARAARLSRAARARLLCAAWLHATGGALGPGHPPVTAARALRRAGQEPLARLVGHHGGAALAALLRGDPPLEREIPRPAGADAGLLSLLDIALVTTSAKGARATPVGVLRELREHRPAGDPAVRVLVAVVARLAEDPATRALVEHVAPRAGAGLR
jgi:hypothetical protein